MDLATLARTSLGANHVFTDPVEKDGTVVVAAAAVRGGGGGGQGTQNVTDQPAQSGSGMGFGLIARPVGAFVIEGGHVRWKPAIDVNKIILGGQLVAATALLALRALFQARALAERRRWPLRVGAWFRSRRPRFAFT